MYVTLDELKNRKSIKKIRKTLSVSEQHDCFTTTVPSRELHGSKFHQADWK